MERKNLKTLLYQVAATQTGVGTGALVNDRITGFDINARAREVAYLKSARLVYSENEAGAVYAYVVRSMLKRSGNDYANNRPLNPNDVVIESILRGTDSYGYLSSSSRGTIYLQPVLWEWPDGFEPAFLDCPYAAGFVTVAAGAGLHQISMDWEFKFWVERLGEREYEKLKLLYGKLG